MSMPLTGAPAGSAPEGITNPPIDDLLDQVSRSTRWSSTRPSGPARSTTTTPSSARACSSTSARSSSRARARSRCRSPCARSRPGCSSTPRAPSSPGRSGVRDRACRPAVLLGVAGGIAAYKACELLRRLTETGHAVRVLPTASALEFVGAATFEALSGQPVHTGVFADVPAVPHVKLGQEADLVVVAPATADLLARAAPAAPTTSSPPRCSRPAARCCSSPRCTPRCGSTRPRGTTWRCCAAAASVVMEPASGRLTGRDTGPAGCPSPPRSPSWPGCCWSGPTRCRATSRAGGWSCPRAAPARRWIPCASSGTARRAGRGTRSPAVAAQRGAAVTLVAAHTADLADPAAVDVVRAGSARELREAVLAAAKGADAVVMAAAVADFRPGGARRQQDQEGVDGAPNRWR